MIHAWVTRQVQNARAGQLHGDTIASSPILSASEGWWGKDGGAKFEGVQDVLPGILLVLALDPA